MLAGSVIAADPCAAQDPIALARAGTAAIEAGRFGDALEAFTQAATVGPEDASVCFGAGIAAFMLGQDDVAQSRFECALAHNPKFLPAAEWLADLHYQAGRLSDAIAVFETLRQHVLLDREFQERLVEWRKEQALQRHFREARSEHFSVLFERADDEPLVRKVIERLEAAYCRIGSTLGLYPSHAITAVLYSREQFDDITKLAAWSAAAFDGSLRVPLGVARERPEELDRVLSHEFVHAVVAMVAGRTVPAWVNEGLATVLEPAGPEDAEATLARSRVRPALSKLHRGFVGLPARDAEVAYAMAARAVRRLIERRGVDTLVALLEDLKAGAPFDRAFHQRIAMPYEDFVALEARD